MPKSETSDFGGERVGVRGPRTLGRHRALTRRTSCADLSPTGRGGLAARHSKTIPLNIPALDLLGQRLDLVGDALEVRVDRLRAAVRIERRRVLADVLQHGA